MVPKVFPWPLFDMLLRDVGSPKADATYTLKHLAAVSPEEADSLGKILAYQAADITEVLGDLGWERVPELAGRILTQETKAEFVDAYVKWCFGKKIEVQFRAFSNGFHSMLNKSVMVQKMLDAQQLERIVSGGDLPVDIAAIRRFAEVQHWRD